jgi:hypothetical protein
MRSSSIKARVRRRSDYPTSADVSRDEGKCWLILPGGHPYATAATRESGTPQ